MADTRNPQRTRTEIIQAAYEEIRVHGFQRASLDNILCDVGVTKGALYHHFKNKLELGYAVIDELIMKEIYERWVIPLQKASKPLDALIEVVKNARACIGKENINYGCPLNNLSQEMSLVDEGFRLRLNRIYENWRTGIASALERAQKGGVIDPGLDVEKAAAFIVAALEGTLGMAKTSQSTAVLDLCVDGLLDYLKHLPHP